MTVGEIASAEEAVRSLVGADVAQLLRPALRVEHRVVVATLEDLPWSTESVDVVADKAMDVLKAATRPGGIVDPKDDEGDMPWVMALKKMSSAPAKGSRSGRRWFTHLEGHLWNDVPVSTVPQAVAAYVVARFEDALGRDHSVSRWMMIAGIQTEHDERHGLGLAVVVRVARLLSWRAP